MANIWKSHQVNGDNIGRLFISTIEQNQIKKGTKDLNALLARLKALVFTGKSFLQIFILLILDF